MTAAIRVLRQHGVQYEPHLYKYELRGGTRVGARELGVDEHLLIKTILLEDEEHHPLIALMHGDQEISTKNLARHLGKKTISPCPPQVADRHSGYQVGGTSPFGTRKAMQVYAPHSMLELPVLYINGGKRGFLVAMSPSDLVRVLKVELLDLAAE